MMSPRERYESDPMFHALVEAIYAQIKTCQFTPTELREAVIFAAIMYEHRQHPDQRRQSLWREKSILDFLDGLEQKKS